MNSRTLLLLPIDLLHFLLPFPLWIYKFLLCLLMDVLFDHGKHLVNVFGYAVWLMFQDGKVDLVPVLLSDSSEEWVIKVQIYFIINKVWWTQLFYELHQVLLKLWYLLDFFLLQTLYVHLFRFEFFCLQILYDIKLQLLRHRQQFLILYIQKFWFWWKLINVDWMRNCMILISRHSTSFGWCQGDGLILPVNWIELSWPLLLIDQSIRHIVLGKLVHWDAIEV